MNEEICISGYYSEAQIEYIDCILIKEWSYGWKKPKAELMRYYWRNKFELHFKAQAKFGEHEWRNHQHHSPHELNILGIFENAHEWKPHHWKPLESRTCCSFRSTFIGKIGNFQKIYEEKLWLVLPGFFQRIVQKRFGILHKRGGGSTKGDLLHKPF